MPELPRLYDLVWLSNSTADNANGILHTDTWYRGIHKGLNKGQRLNLFLVPTLEPSSTTDGEVCARGVCNHKVPLVVQYLSDISYNMLAGALARQQITRRSIV